MICSSGWPGTHQRNLNLTCALDIILSGPHSTEKKVHKRYMNRCSQQLYFQLRSSSVWKQSPRMKALRGQCERPLHKAVAGKPPGCWRCSDMGICQGTLQAGIGNMSKREMYVAGSKVGRRLCHLSTLKS